MHYIFVSIWKRIHKIHKNLENVHVKGNCGNMYLSQSDKYIFIVYYWKDFHPSSSPDGKNLVNLRKRDAI